MTNDSIYSWRCIVILGAKPRGVLTELDNSDKAVAYTEVIAMHSVLSDRIQSDGKERDSFEPTELRRESV